MLYAVTAQSHYRAMALLTQRRQVQRPGRRRQEDASSRLLDAMEQADPADAAVLRRRPDGQRPSTRVASEQVLALYDGRRPSRAPPGSISSEEHPDLARARGVDADAHRHGRPADGAGAGGIRVRPSPAHDTRSSPSRSSASSWRCCSASSCRGRSSSRSARWARAWRDHRRRPRRSASRCRTAMSSDSSPTT